MVVNNDEDTMSLLKMWLEKKMYKVQYTSSQEEVPQLVKDFNPQLLIVDVLQKDVVEKLKQNHETSHLPVLLMTGYTQRQNLTSSGANDTIEKPFNLRILEKKIEKLVS